MSDASKPPVVRSPSYPSMSLRDAVAAVRKIEAAYRGNAADREQAAKLIGYSGISGPSAKALAALASYGLVERAGKGEMRVSSRAITILHGDPDKRADALLSASVEPGIFQEIKDKWPGIVPPEDGIAAYLRKLGFNESAVRPTVAAYLDTLAFLAENSVSESHGQRAEAAQESAPPTRGAGFFGSQRMQEYAVEQGGAQKPDAPREQRPAGTSGVEMILGPNTRATINVTGDLGAKEIGKLIRLLEAQKAVLEDD